MPRCLFSLTLTSLALLHSAAGVSFATASIIERDWLAPGDGLLTYDTVNQREWLDLSKTLLTDQFPGTGANELEIREARYQYVVSQTTPGGMFEGFTVANSDDVIELALSAGIDVTSQSYAINSAPTLTLSTLLSFTIESPNGNKFAVGLLDELGGLSPPNRKAAIFQLIFTSQAGLRIDDPVLHLQTLIPPGVMLYREVIPEPTTFMLFVLVHSSSGIAGADFMRDFITLRSSLSSYRRRG